MRELEECRLILAPIDRQGLLSKPEVAASESADSMSDDELLAELEDFAEQDEITELRHVRASAEKRAAEEIASRTPCPDFDKFKPAFEQMKSELKARIRQTRLFKTKGIEEIQQGSYFIVGGQIAYVAEVGEEFATPFNSNRTDSRLRVIYDNGTESNILQRSLQRALHRDEAARMITDPNPGPLFSETWDEGDIESGTIYVLRSHSDHPFIAENRSLIHKIGVTGNDVTRRLANAVHEATYLLAEVEVVATYKLAGIDRTGLETLIHRIFAPAQLDLEIKDRFGSPVKPREWFLVPIQAINEAIEKIRDGSITKYIYDPKLAQLVLRDGKR